MRILIGKTEREEGRQVLTLCVCVCVPKVARVARDATYTLEGKEKIRV